ncbi:helix-turn-helix transcriptional regulator [Mesorhizobium sp. M4B.F.Ca.ET.215.01.1.1]|uniref:helix-turn-helix transcriptional regulator n=1 Tax=unclassified Mesorhizobium TaxID=325217 RepID=UPI000FCB1AEC|nr:MULTISPECIES: helix-turn-helix transcriptional regulator [unclassified Mesorhizobium]RVD41487.1 helix-turn-helix transcriptional regulator [Mesorhizobium sp. M4B.F.Ca.ET.019.03.1.1]RWF64269.1 MAG: helix-turn-helix transcriptional regulator [Mesorhizobium sp.]TGQ12887.1 helix-turn-helix transcriptional regulator [Mesorhizobium sp. M4B.F.Ca.ET.215.01.1.1]TGQ43198.1 helix-turn-helix transcriptional regulator [Mesorhizobium sp. M4B.F.Ca.ET.214.01.1.1]TGQ46491.1 helix-turn-helix transcriptional 
MERLSSEILGSIVGDIYDCVLNPDGWTGVMIRITETMDAAYSTIALASTADNHGRFAARSPWDPERMRVLQEDYDFDAIPGLKAAVVGDIDTPVATLSHISEAELQQTPFYQNWAKPQGLREGCIIKFVHTPDRIGLMGCTTRAGRGIISVEEQRFMALLSPHLRRASLIGDLLDQARVTASLYRQALDHLAVPVVLTGASGAILHANEAAQQMLSVEGPIRSRNGLLQAQNPAVALALQEAIASAARADASLGSRGIGLPISAPGQPPAVAYVLPLTEGTARAAFRPACAAVFVSTTTSASPLPEAVLTTLFDLTPAEARVLLRIGSGLSAPRSAVALGIGENTLKTHLNRIFAKTGTRRQADLVKLISDMGAPLAGPEST